MLRMNQLAGFGVRSDAQAAPFVAPSIRFTKNYSFSYGGTTSATVTVPGADLGASDSTKQILVVIAEETPLITQVTIDGVRAGQIITDVGVRLAMFSAPYTGSGPFNIVVTISATSSESNSLAVYEVSSAALLYKGQRGQAAVSATTAVAATRQPVNGLFVGGIMDTTDTVTFSWSSLTEDLDADGGDSRIGSAKNGTPAAAKTTLSETVTISSSTVAGMALLAILPTNVAGVTGGMHSSTTVAGSGTTWTNTSSTDFTGLGDFKLVVGVCASATATISSVTFNGNAMTSLGSVVNTGASPDLICHFFSIDVTQAGGASGSIVITASTTITLSPARVTKWAFYGVGSISAVQSAQGNATGAAVNIDVAEGGTILALHSRTTDTQSVTWTGVENLIDASTGAGVVMRAAAAQHSYSDVETGRTVQATGSASGQYATLAIALNP